MHDTIVYRIQIDGSVLYHFNTQSAYYAYVNHYYFSDGKSDHNRRVFFLFLDTDNDLHV